MIFRNATVPAPVSIAFFGVVGVLLRYGLDAALAGVMSPYPTSTFMINIAGSFLVGLFYSVGTENGSIPRDWTTAMSIGLLGGFTAFSAYGLQTVMLAKNGNLAVAALYFLLSPVLSLLGALAGMSLARALG